MANFTSICMIIVIGIAISIKLFGVQMTAFLGNSIDKFGNDLLIKGYIPDTLIRFAVDTQLKQRLNDLDEEFTTTSYATAIDSFVSDLRNRSLTAEATQDANDQHYEVDTSFYDHVLGHFKKYSSTIYLTEQQKSQKIYEDKPSISLQQAYDVLDESEVDMLELYVKRLELCTGDDCKLKVLDLGCGWGSFSLFYASKCPNCEIRSISNSQSQIDYINGKAKEYGFKNLKAMRQNVNELDAFADKMEAEFDRIISIEMFEHMKNYQILLGNLRKLLKCDGKLFVHMFVHKDKPYHFEQGWMSRHFFTGGTMLSHELLGRFDDDFKMEQSWIVNGVHYSYTLETWLHLMDENGDDVKQAIANIYGNDEDTITKWWYLWRTFFIACSQLFKYNAGEEWYVGHYLLAPRC